MQAITAVIPASLGEQMQSGSADERVNAWRELQQGRRTNWRAPTAPAAPMQRTPTKSAPPRAPRGAQQAPQQRLPQQAPQQWRPAPAAPPQRGLPQGGLRDVMSMLPLLLQQRGGERNAILPLLMQAQQGGGNSVLAGAFGNKPTSLAEQLLSFRDARAPYVG